ncbi:MAG: protein kinase domain-containing protein [Betaproteobacteria bacterium]
MSEASADWWRRVSPYLDEALDLSGPERSAWLASLRERDPELANRLHGLLEEHDGLAQAGYLEQHRAALLPPPLAAGTVVGAYTLLARIGEGGMGTVWLGERSDGEIQQRVAIKFLGAAGHRLSWRDRFLKERQLLVSLDHPSIVRVIDAGHTDAGMPYLVMEYVEGSPIDVAAARLPIDERLRLLLGVCDAVSYAHRHLIVHRDLKPSNILVDTAGQPKLLDFGIAKLLDDTVEATQTIDRLLTPNYASPEQLRGSPQTTATDVYSLGAVLYKLLTGRSPYEVVKTATRAPGGQAASDVPPASRLNPDLPADADFVLRKALREEPEERYASVDALSRDIHALLDGRPVEARSGDAWYRTRKLVRQYWVPVAATTLVIGSLAIGQFVADRERARADRRFGQLRHLAQQVIDLDAAIRNLPGATAARQRLVSISLNYLEGLAADARGDVDLMREVGEAYWHIGRLQGLPSELNLGQPVQADASLAKADTLIEMVVGARPSDRSVLLRSASIAHDRMIIAQSSGRNDDAVTYARAAVGRLERFQRAGTLSVDERGQVAAMYSNVALALVNMHRYAEAIPLARRGVDVAPSDPGGARGRASALSVLASALRYQGHLEAALRAIRDAEAISREVQYPGGNERLVLRMTNRYGVLLREGLILGEAEGVNLNRPDDAIGPLQEALDLTEAAARADPHDATSRARVGTSGRELGNILRDRDPRRALAVYDLAVRRLREIPNNVRARRDEARTLAESAYALRRLGRTAEAGQRVKAALALLTATKDLPPARVALDSETCAVLRALADQEAGEGDLRAAIDGYVRLIDAAMVSKPDLLGDLRDATAMSRLYGALAALYRRSGAVEEADAIAGRRLDLWRHWQEKLPDNAFVPRQIAATRGR